MQTATQVAGAQLRTSASVCKAVRAVGIVKPKFNPQQKGFLPPSLEVKGSGFWLKQEHIFITCAHVILELLGAPIELTGMLVVGGNGAEYKKATITSIDYGHDLAVLEIDADSAFIEAQSQTGLDIVDRNIEVGERVSYAGFPFGNQLLNERHSPTYAEGVVGSEIIESQGLKKIQVSGPIVGGYSGAPIVLQEDPSKVIAIVSHSPSKEAGDASIFMGIHWKHIRGISLLTNS